MARPYSVDLRERVVRAVENGASRRAIAAKFEVSISFVVKLLQRWRHERSLAALRALAMFRGSTVYREAAEAFMLVRQVI